MSTIRSNCDNKNISTDHSVIDISNHRGLKRFHINIRSLLPKLDLLHNIIHEHNVDILSINKFNLDFSMMTMKFLLMDLLFLGTM